MYFGEKVMKFKFVFALFLTSTVVVFFIHEINKKNPVHIPSCKSNFVFGDFEVIPKNKKTLRDLSNNYFEKIVNINRDTNIENYCVLSLKGSDSCLHYFRTDDVAGGDYRICVNVKAGGLISVVSGSGALHSCP